MRTHQTSRQGKCVKPSYASYRNVVNDEPLETLVTGPDDTYSLLQYMDVPDFGMITIPSSAELGQLPDEDVSFPVGSHLLMTIWYDAETDGLHWKLTPCIRRRHHPQNWKAVSVKVCERHNKVYLLKEVNSTIYPKCVRLYSRRAEVLLLPLDPYKRSRMQGRVTPAIPALIVFKRGCTPIPVGD